MRKAKVGKEKQMTVKSEISSIREFEAWAGAKDNLKEVFEAGKVDELDCLLEDLFGDEPVSDTTLNDFLWFDLPESFPEMMEA